MDPPSVTVACGTLAASQWRTWAAAWGWVRTRRTSPSVVPGRPNRVNSTGRMTSRTIISRRPFDRLSRVTLTPPSTEFSIGTRAPSTAPLRTASSAWPTVANGIASASLKVCSAWWVKVPAGPKYPSTQTG